MEYKKYIKRKPNRVIGEEGEYQFSNPISEIFLHMGDPIEVFLFNDAPIEETSGSITFNVLNIATIVTSGSTTTVTIL